MTIYVSAYEPGLLEGENNQKFLNLFFEKLTPCPNCLGEEIILRFGRLPYIVCLNCGWGHGGGMTGILGEATEEKVVNYLEEWRENGRRFYRGDLSRFTGLVRSPLFKIKVEGGAEGLKSYIVEPVDEGYRQKLERLLEG